MRCDETVKVVKYEYHDYHQSKPSRRTQGRTTAQRGSQSTFRRTPLRQQFKYHFFYSPHLARPSLVLASAPDGLHPLLPHLPGFCPLSR